jgi:hypothetical protein
MPKRDESNTTIDTGNKQQPRLIGDKLETLKPPPEEPPTTTTTETAIVVETTP